MPKIGRPPSDPIARFNSKIRCGDSIDSCWEWTSAKNRAGYGQFTLWGKCVFAHRLSLSLASREFITSDRLVIHSCDNPSCVNPDHLRTGTPADNSRDMVLRARNEKGEKHWVNRYPERITRGNTHWARKDSSRLRGQANGRALIGPSEVNEIRKLVANGVKQGKVASMFGVSRTAVNNIWTGKTWSHT